MQYIDAIRFRQLSIELYTIEEQTTEIVYFLRSKGEFMFREVVCVSKARLTKSLKIP